MHNNYARVVVASTVCSTAVYPVDNYARVVVSRQAHNYARVVVNYTMFALFLYSQYDVDVMDSCMLSRLKHILHILRACIHFLQSSLVITAQYETGRAYLVGDWRGDQSY